LKRNINVGETAMYGVLLLLAFGANISTAATSCAILLGAGIMLIQGVRTKSWPAVDRGLGKAILGYLVIQCIIAAFSYEPMVSFGDVWAIAYRFLPLFFAMLYTKTQKQLAGLWLLFAVSVFLDDIVAAYQLVHAGQFRPYGFNNTPTFFSSHMLMALPVLFLAAQKSYISIWGRRFIVFTGVLSFIMLIACETRGGWVAFAAVVLGLACLEKQYRKRIAGSIVVIGIVVFMAGHVFPLLEMRAASIIDPHNVANSERILMWKSALHISEDYPVLGIGQDEFGVFYNSWYISPSARERPTTSNPRSGHGHPHNNILKMLSEGGVVGLMAFFLFYSYLFYRLYRLYKEERGKLNISYALAGMLIFIGIQVEGLTDTNMNQVPIMREFWFLMGLLFVAGRIELAAKNQGKSL
jgi:O-antigen ligase